MARAQFQKGQKVWVESVGVWTTVEKVQPVWARGFDEPVRVTYDVGLGREFQAHELMVPVDEAPSAGGLGRWRVMRGRNKWQTDGDCQHHPLPGTYPIVVTDAVDWGGWRVPGAEYDRDPDRIEFQARLIAAAPQLLALAQRLMEVVAEAPEDAPPQAVELARQAQAVVRPVIEVALPRGEVTAA